MGHSENRILTALPDSERGVLAPLLKSSVLKQHEKLYEAHETIEIVYFPLDAVASLVVPLSSGEAIEAATVGHDGVVGAAAVLNGWVSPNRAVVQLSGSTQSCAASALRQALGQCPRLSYLLVKHEQLLFAQAQQSAACNISHHLESRMARWLLRARDLARTDELVLTQEYLAAILGVRRTSVSLIAHTLQQAGLLSYRRGHVKILNIDGLKEVSCECYEAVRLHYDSLQRENSNA